MLRNTRENGNSRTATPPVVVGDRVDLVGDLSGDEGALARIVRVAERTSVLHRTADDTDPNERVVVANASHLVIVTALADPEPRTGFVDRCLVATRRCWLSGSRPDGSLRCAASSRRFGRPDSSSSADHRKSVSLSS